MKDASNNDIDSKEEMVEAEAGNNAESQASADVVNVTELLKQIDALQSETRQHQESFFRARADLENYRRRAAREKEELYKTAASKVIEGLLPILDNFYLGLESAHKHPEAKVVTDGFEMVFNQLKTLLADQGLETLSPEGAPFDPNEHECLAHQPHETAEEDTVIQVVRVGYKLNGQLLRAASVIVSSGKPA